MQQKILSSHNSPIKINPALLLFWYIHITNKAVCNGWSTSVGETKGDCGMQTTVRRQVEFVFALCEISEPWTATVSSPRVWKNQLHQTVKTDGSFMALQRWESSITFCVNHGCQISFFSPPPWCYFCADRLWNVCSCSPLYIRFRSSPPPPFIYLSLHGQHRDWPNNEATAAIVAPTQSTLK